MAIERSAIKEIADRIKNDLKLSALELNAVRNNFTNSIISSMAGGFDENNDLIEQALKQLFIQTAEGEFLEDHGITYGITRKEATKSKGRAIFTGTSGINIPIDTTLSTADGLQYITKQQGTIINSTTEISSLVRLASTVTATTVSNHNYATGQLITITGADQTEYNITNKSIVVTAENQFTFDIESTPISPATTSSTIIANTTFTFIEIESVNFGSGNNQDSGSVLLLDTPIIGVNDQALVNFNGLVGGSDQEDDEELRLRIKERKSNLTAPFTEVGIPIFIKQNTVNINRIWVKTASPNPGQTQIYFVKDNQVNILPSSQDLQDVKNLLTGQIAGVEGIKPADMSDSNLFVLAPVLVNINFTFSSLSPNTEDMKNAITESLTSFFNSESINLEQQVLKNEYESVIFNTLDSAGNSPVYTLSSPTTDIVVNNGEIASLGTIDFN